MSSQAKAIQQYILKHVASHPRDIAAIVCERFSVSRMTAVRQLQALLAAGEIVKSGKTYDTQYFLPDGKNKSLDLPIDNELQEFTVFKKYFLAELSALPKNQFDICEYVMTELINNIKDHSEGKYCHIETHWSAKELSIVISDDGLGLFEKLRQSLQLVDLQEGLLALSKGKVTTDPENHTGEGIFFSSRAVDRFQVEANDVRYTKDNIENDWFFESCETEKGTRIQVVLRADCKRILRDVFDDYTEESDFKFDKTEILVELSKLGDERYISRSQAKRITAGLEKFSRVILDFRDVVTVGQGFVDEVFRVFQNKYPNIKITYRNANEDVTFMIKRGLS